MAKGISFHIDWLSRHPVNLRTIHGKGERNPVIDYMTPEVERFNRKESIWYAKKYKRLTNG